MVAQEYVIVKTFVQAESIGGFAVKGLEHKAEFMTPGERVLTAMRREEPDRALLIAPTHLVEPEVPWENIMALVEAVEEFGYYR